MGRARECRRECREQVWGTPAVVCRYWYGHGIGTITVLVLIQGRQYGGTLLCCVTGVSGSKGNVARGEAKMVDGGKRENTDRDRGRTSEMAVSLLEISLLQTNCHAVHCVARLHDHTHSAHENMYELCRMWRHNLTSGVVLLSVHGVALALKSVWLSA